MEAPSASSFWQLSLEDFREKVGSRDPSVAAVAVASVAAACAANLAVMVLEINANRKNFQGDPKRIEALVEASRAESGRLARYADEDPAAYAWYMRCARLPKNTESERAYRDREITSALHRATEVPLSAARSAMAALNICAEAAGLAHGAVATDLGGASMLLAGAIRAMLLSVDSNLKALGESEFTDQIAAERAELEQRAARQADAVRERIAG